MSSRGSPTHSTTSPLANSSTSLPPAPTGTLGRLVTHFVASKRSLSSTAHVYRANEIVSSARTLLESIAANTAQATFLRRAIDNQLNILKGIHHGLCIAAEEGSDDFQVILKRLDAADVLIQDTLHALRRTEIEPTFRPADEGSRSLHSFLDERGVVELKSQFRECIDLTTEAHRDFEDLNAELGEEIDGIEGSLDEDDGEEIESRRGLVVSEIHESEENDGPAALFRSMEEHASETAELLQSLVKHYDLCITALKNTEGGGEAAHAALRRSSRDTADVDDKFRDTIGDHSMSAEEHAEMLGVLDEDASEVDDVVSEIRERAAEMEAQLSRLDVRAKKAQGDQRKATKTMSKLEDVSTSGRLSKYVNGSKVYTERCKEIKGRIETSLDEFSHLADFFKGFKTAYQYLLLEIDRRRRTRVAMDKVITETQQAIADLYEEEDEKRRQFRAQYGDFLPADMWPPLIDPPTKWTIERNDDGTVDIPIVREDSLSRAKSELQSQRRSRG